MDSGEKERTAFKLLRKGVLAPGVQEVKTSGPAKGKSGRGPEKE